MSERCNKCNRVLKDALSKERGFGPVCWTKYIYAKEHSKNQDRLFRDPELQFKGNIILQRGPTGTPLTNVPQQEVVHSPNGFEWGYGGSGPADLALNILLMYTDKETAKELYQIFKWDYVTKMPHDGGTITGREIRRWIKRHRREAS